MRDNSGSSTGKHGLFTGTIINNGSNGSIPIDSEFGLVECSQFFLTGRIGH